MDEKLIRAALNGDDLAFEEVYKKTYPRAHAIALGVVKDEYEAFDIVQEAYITMLQKGGTLEDPRKIESWFAQVVRNAAIDFVRKNRPALFTDLENPEESDTAFEDSIPAEYAAFDPEKAADYAETKKIMQELIDQLPNKQRICIMLRWKEDKKISEIAQLTGLSEATVKSCLRYGHEKLAKSVEELEKKGTKLYGIAPLALIPFLRWMLGGKAPAQAAAAAAKSSTLAAASSASVSAASASSASASAAAAAGTAAGTSFVTKLVAGVLTAVLTVGGAIGIVQIAQPEQPRESESVEVERPPVYTTTFGDTIVLTPQPLTEFEDQAPDVPSQVLDTSKNVVMQEHYTYIREDSPQHYIGTTPVTRVVIPEYLPKADPAFWFMGLTNVVSIEGLQNVDLSTAHTLNYTFYGCKSLERIEGIADWDVSNVLTMNFTFYGCESLVYLEDFSNWRPQRILQMQSMFENCRKLTSIRGFANWDLSETTDLFHMFRNCTCLTYVDGLENLGGAIRAVHVRMLEGTAISPLPLWYIEYELCGTDRPEGDIKDYGCFTEESLRIFHAANPDWPAIEGHPWPDPLPEETLPADPENTTDNIGATDNPTGFDPEDATEPTDFVGMYPADEEQDEDIFIGMYPADEE